MGARFVVGVVTGMSVGLLASPDLHVPLRPSWRCTDDGAEWPCAVHKRRLWRSSGGRRHLVAEEMARWMASARAELPGLSAEQLFERFAGWIAAGPPKAQVVVTSTQRPANEPGG